MKRNFIFVFAVLCMGLMAACGSKQQTAEATAGEVVVDSVEVVVDSVADVAADTVAVDTVVVE